MKIIMKIFGGVVLLFLIMIGWIFFAGYRSVKETTLVTISASNYPPTGGTQDSPNDDYPNYAQNTFFSPQLDKVGFISLNTSNSDDVNEFTNFVSINNQKEKEYPSISGPIVFSSDGEKHAYRAMDSRRYPQSYFVVTNGKEGPKYQYIKDLAFTPTGSLMYLAFTADSEALLIENDRVIKKLPTAFTFSPITKDVATAEKVGTQVVVFSDKTRSRAYDRITTVVSFSPDGTVMGYGAQFNNKNYIVLGSKEEEIPDGRVVKPPVFNADNTKIAYVINVNGKEIMVHDGQRSSPYNSIEERPVFSTDGQHLSFIARKDQKTVLVVDGEEKEIGSAWHHSLTFSPDSQDFLRISGERSTAEFIKNGFKILVDEPANIINPIYYAFGFGGVQNRVITKEHKGKLYDEVYNPRFSENGTSIEYGALNHRTYVKVIENIK